MRRLKHGVVLRATVRFCQSRQTFPSPAQTRSTRRVGVTAALPRLATGVICAIDSLYSSTVPATVHEPLEDNVTECSPSGADERTRRRWHLPALFLFAYFRIQVLQKRFSHSIKRNKRCEEVRGGQAIAGLGSDIGCCSHLLKGLAETAELLKGLRYTA